MHPNPYEARARRRMLEEARRPYVLTMADRHGPVLRRRYPDFEALLEGLRALRDTYRGRERAFVAGNVDRADVGDDGLTEEERRAIEEVG